MVFINRTRYETPCDLMSAGAMFMAERARFFFFFFCSRRYVKAWKHCL